MANRKASIWLYKKIDGRWRYVKPAIGRNGKIKPDPDAAYYVRYREGGKMVWRKCSSAADATVACERQEAYLTAVVHGLTLSQTERGEKTPLMVSNLLLPYLEEYRLLHREESYNLMKHTLHEFFGYWDEKGRRVRGFVSANLIEHIRRYDLLRFKQHLIDKGRSERTAANKCLRINQFIRSVLKLDPGKGLITVKDMKFTEAEVSVYNDDELEDFSPFEFGSLSNCLMTSRVAFATAFSLSVLKSGFCSGCAASPATLPTINGATSITFIARSGMSRPITTPVRMIESGLFASSMISWKWS